MSTFSTLRRFTVLSLLARYALCLSVSVPLAAPSTAPTLSPSLLSLSIEQDRWTDWSGTTSRNEFVFNTMNNLVKLTGEPPQFRIGADSEDRTDFNPNVQFVENVFPAPNPTTPYPEASNNIVGDGYYQAAQWLPPNTHVIWGLNLKTNNITSAFLNTKSLVKAFSSSAIKRAGITLDFIEIGNEADFYGLSLSDYIQRWTAFATNVTAAAKLSPSSKTKFYGGAFALSSGTTTGFSPQGLITNGILSSPAGALITTMSQHRYSGSFCAGSGGLLQDLMTKSTIRSNLTVFNPDIAATRAKGLDYVLGETNSYACHGAPGVSNTAGAAIWALDYVLFAPQIGISRVFLHQGVGYKYSMIQPVALTRSPLDGTTLATPLPAHIQPQYHAALIIAEAIGRSGNTRAIELSVDDSRTSAYAFYNGKKLARVLLINSDAFLTTTTTPRTSTQISLGITGSGAPKKMTVKRLSIPFADSTSGLTWGGQTYETSNGKVSGTLKTTTVDVSAGVSIQQTEVILLTFY
ncbi:hypothetical protein GALMADRAFT_58958 [Galerina marginata CBS 339.88]|uniref:Beta-glucuronidase C-terminal domain-containing protein n=1 Tax=Galerina marginata (strain CBS 339.88) TaxID=685588 RepID=A0A067TGI8_GALM3|nr:hypothetical protein GALMADRAFT_58958 [Galerina marginata CBS 339.88]